MGSHELIQLRDIAIAAIPVVPTIQAANQEHRVELIIEDKLPSERNKYHLKTVATIVADTAKSLLIPIIIASAAETNTPLDQALKENPLLIAGYAALTIGVYYLSKNLRLSTDEMIMKV